ncbi:MAG: helicase-related protein [Desulfomonilaceae bacterium]
MKDPLDVERQNATADEILRRFFAENSDPRWYIQILADEVGMGKTYVGLAVAYSILDALQSGQLPKDLKRCHRSVLIITPSNVALNIKWQREVREFVKRCVVSDQAIAGEWFAPVSLKSIEQFVEAFSGREEGPRVFITTMGVLKGFNSLSMKPCKDEKAFPLVIVDEAHNWKNGPSKGVNAYSEFKHHIGRRTRRALLLTATPFQLSPAEMLEVLKVGDHLMPSPDAAESCNRCDELRKYRENILIRALNASQEESERFSKSWSRLPDKVTGPQLKETWTSQRFGEARERLRSVVFENGNPAFEKLEPIVEYAIAETDYDVRGFMAAALRLFVYNCNLSYELGRMVIRHRRRNEHRLVRVGAEFLKHADELIGRPDSHILHGAPGMDVGGEGELPHYLLMRCVSLMKKESGKPGVSSLGSNLTGCYSTLMESAEGKEVKELLQHSPEGGVYWTVLRGMVSREKDPMHPKLKEVVDSIVKCWGRGEKTLVFCFRVNTAKRLTEIINDRIKSELKQRQSSCLGEEWRLSKLLGRFKNNTGGLVVIGLDRVLWSFMWAEQLSPEMERSITDQELRLQAIDMEELARLSLLFGVRVTGSDADRVFLTRCTEHAVSKRLLKKRNLSEPWKKLLDQMSRRSWVSHPYGRTPTARKEAAKREHFDEQGVNRVYEEGDEPVTSKVEERVRLLRQAQRQGSLLDAYAKGPNLWLGPGLPPEGRRVKGPPWSTFRKIHQHLWALSLDAGPNFFDWESRRRVCQALRRSVLRESVLVRLLPSDSERDESLWGDLLVKSFIKHLPSQRESWADRVAVFLEDLAAASGSLSEDNPGPENARESIYQATLLDDQETVALITGGSGTKAQIERRDRVFTGFNTPLVPEVLVCTQVGQEGIDLHRHCRHVVHYDLGWNPAVIEQRTGRADRIGSKTFRERGIDLRESGTFLEIGLPYLAGTYDERMYKQLRLRSQVFEVLMGGDVAGQDPEGDDTHDDLEGKEDGGLKLVPLPDEMVAQLRVNLQIWKPNERAPDKILHITQDSRSS